MEEKISELRKEIDVLDKSLVELLEKRFTLFRKIYSEKISKNIRLDDPERENEIISKASVTSDLKKEVINDFFSQLFKEFKTKAQQNRLKYIVASGPVIIEGGKLLVNKDNKDDFYKLPGGTVEEDELSLESACHRETKEENNAEISVIRPLNPMIIWKNPQTGEKMAILLIHYLAKLKNKEELKPIPPIKEVTWLDIEEIKQGKHYVAPNILYLIDKGDII